MLAVGLAGHDDACLGILHSLSENRITLGVISCECECVVRPLCLADGLGIDDDRLNHLVYGMLAVALSGHDDACLGIIHSLSENRITLLVVLSVSSLVLDLGAVANALCRLCALCAGLFVLYVVGLTGNCPCRLSLSRPLSEDCVTGIAIFLERNCVPHLLGLGNGLSLADCGLNLIVWRILIGGSTCRLLRSSLGEKGVTLLVVLSVSSLVLDLGAVANALCRLCALCAGLFVLYIVGLTGNGSCRLGLSRSLCEDCVTCIAIFLEGEGIPDLVRLAGGIVADDDGSYDLVDVMLAVRLSGHDPCRLGLSHPLCDNGVTRIAIFLEGDSVLDLVAAADRLSLLSLILYLVLGLSVTDDNDGCRLLLGLFLGGLLLRGFFFLLRGLLLLLRGLFSLCDAFLLDGGLFLFFGCLTSLGDLGVTLLGIIGKSECVVALLAHRGLLFFLLGAILLDLVLAILCLERLYALLELIEPVVDLTLLGLAVLSLLFLLRLLFLYALFSLCGLLLGGLLLLLGALLGLGCLASLLVPLGAIFCEATCIVLFVVVILLLGLFALFLLGLLLLSGLLRLGGLLFLLRGLLFLLRGLLFLLRGLLLFLGGLFLDGLFRLLGLPCPLILGLLFLALITLGGKLVDSSLKLGDPSLLGSSLSVVLTGLFLFRDLIYAALKLGNSLLVLLDALVVGALSLLIFFLILFEHDAAGLAGHIVLTEHTLDLVTSLLLLKSNLSVTLVVVFLE